MNHIVVKLSFLFLAMCVLTSSREDAGISKPKKSLVNTKVCLNSRNDYAFNAPCKQKPVLKEKKDDLQTTPVADYDMPLSPISRFILFQ